MKWLPITIFLFTFNNYARAYIITIDSHEEECFFDRVEENSKMGLQFEIVDGGFLDIEVKITGPGDKVIYQATQESSGKYTFTADTSGIYTYCFSNQQGTMTPKVIMFSMDIGEPPSQNQSNKDQDDDGNNHGKLDDMIKELSTSLIGVKSEQEYMQVRDRNHRAINESTNFRVGIWSVFEAMALVCMTLGQIYYLKRFFEVRRVV